MSELRTKWYDVEGYEDLIQINDKFEVWSKYREITRVYPDGHTDTMKKLPRKLKVFYDKDGYAYVSLGKNNKQINIKLATVMAETFIPNPNHYTEVNHIDGNKANYLPSNLEWVTHKENIHHARLTGLIHTKLSPKEIKDIKLSNLSRKELANMYQVSLSTIDRINNGSLDIYIRSVM